MGLWGMGTGGVVPASCRAQRGADTEEGWGARMGGIVGSCSSFPGVQWGVVQAGSALSIRREVPTEAWASVDHSCLLLPPRPRATCLAPASPLRLCLRPAVLLAPLPQVACFPAPPHPSVHSIEN